MKAYLLGTAAQGIIQDLGDFGDPNLLLQTELVFTPTVLVTPPALPPIVLFENSFMVSGAQTITLNNTGNASVSVNVGA